MAGFFGFFNYEKEGPGIDKNAPKKKTFIVFFETFFRNFGKFVSINVVYTILSLPLFTYGIAAAGITNVTRNIARDKHSFGLSDFFDTVKDNWKQSLAAGFINTIVFAILIFAILFYFSMEGLVAAIGMGISMAALLVMLVMNFYIWTMIITFKLTLKQIYKNSFKFVFINLKNNLICGICQLLVYALYIAIPYIFQKQMFFVIIIEILLAAITLPAFQYLLIQFCTFPAIKKYMIDPYYAEHPNEDLQQRRNLGLETNEKQSDEESTFSDEIQDTE